MEFENQCIATHNYKTIFLIGKLQHFGLFESLEHKSGKAPRGIDRLVMEERDEWPVFVYPLNCIKISCKTHKYAVKSKNSPAH